MCKINYTRLLVTVILSCLLSWHVEGSEDHEQKQEEVWEQDVSDAFNIDASTNDIKGVNLKCGSNSMYVRLETNEDFTGVMYTRGSYSKQREPCFVKPVNGRARSLEMKFPFDQCQTIQNGDVFSNVVVIQHDPELVTPGDSAFSLECDFRKARSLSVEADYKSRDSEPKNIRQYKENQDSRLRRRAYQGK